MKCSEMKKNPPAGYRIYRFTFPDGKIYIGQTKRYVYIRFLDGYKNKRLMNAIEQYGWDRMTVDILVDGLETKDQANEEEIKYIALLNACDPNVGYNISMGGDLGFLGLRHTEDARKKMSESGRGKHSGPKNYNYMRKKSDAEIEKARIAKKDKMKPVVQMSMDYEPIMIFESLSAAARAFHTSVRNIRMCVTGKSKTACGYHWRYAS